MPRKLKFPLLAGYLTGYFYPRTISPVNESIFLAGPGIKFHDVKNGSVICGCNLRFSRNSRRSDIRRTLGVKSRNSWWKKLFFFGHNSRCRLIMAPFLFFRSAKRSRFFSSFTSALRNNRRVAARNT